MSHLTMTLPQDPYIKSQYVNIMLKANNMDLNTFCINTGIDMITLAGELGGSSISYNPVNRQFII